MKTLDLKMEEALLSRDKAAKFLASKGETRPTKPRRRTRPRPRPLLTAVDPEVERRRKLIAAMDAADLESRRRRRG
jgi:hypothetical protein